MEGNNDLDEILKGLSKIPKRLPSKYFYDKKGSELFDRICELDEYYLTRTELSILSENINSISDCFEDDSVLLEFGSGSSTKTRLFLENIDNLGGYIPIDISKKHLDHTVEQLNSEFPGLEIHQLAADYTHPLELPKVHSEAEQRIIFFSGSTIGNFTKSESEDFFNVIRKELRMGDGFILGADLVKDRAVLESAYNDSKNITAEFNLNLLKNINNKFIANFETENFEHEAVYNDKDERIEMYLISKCDQEVTLGNSAIKFTVNEKLLTEYSHKYRIESIERLVDGLFKISKVWTDKDKYFAVLYLEPQ